MMFERNPESLSYKPIYNVLNLGSLIRYSLARYLPLF